MNFEIHQANIGVYGWRLRDATGRIIAVSERIWLTASAARAAVAELLAEVAAAEVVEL